MATKQLKKNEIKFEDFEPASELQDLPEKYILLVNLPGLRKEDFRVQVDSLGKLSVKGQKQIDQNKFKRIDKVFKLPPDSDVEKIRGKFEGEVLTLTLPKKLSKAPPSIQEAKSGAEAVEDKPKEELKAKEEKEETKPKEEPNKISKGKEEETKPKEETHEKVKEEPKTSSEKREELAKVKEETSMPEKKEVASRINDAINKWKQNNSSGEIDETTMKRSEKNKLVSWKERISQETKGWSDYASFDNMLETIHRNKKVIAVAVAAFSIGFIVSRKLSSRK